MQRLGHTAKSWALSQDNWKNITKFGWGGDKGYLLTINNDAETQSFSKELGFIIRQPEEPEGNGMDVGTI